MAPQDASATPAIPPELVRAIPRPVRLTAAGKFAAAFALVLAAGAAAAGIALYLAHHSDRVRLERIRQEAVRAEAEVIQTGLTRDKQRRRFVDYQYEVGGRLYTGRFTARRRDAGDIKVGSRVAIRYLPSEPARSWRAGHEPAGVPLWVAVAVPAGLIVSAIAILLPLRGQRNLVSTGRAALGHVTHAEPRMGRDGFHRVHYEFRLLSGARRSGSFHQEKTPPPPGSPVVVLYDPENPRRQGRYPFSLVRAASPQEW